MHKRRNGPIPVYDPDSVAFDFGGIPVSDLDEFLWLNLRWRDTNALARYAEKEEEWNRLCRQVKYHKMYEWKDEYIVDWFQKNAKMYLPNKYHKQLLREMAV